MNCRERSKENKTKISLEPLHKEFRLFAFLLGFNQMMKSERIRWCYCVSPGKYQNHVVQMNKLANANDLIVNLLSFTLCRTILIHVTAKNPFVSIHQRQSRFKSFHVLCSFQRNSYNFFYYIWNLSRIKLRSFYC
jgi:hypothetical protein